MIEVVIFFLLLTALLTLSLSTWQIQNAGKAVLTRRNENLNLWQLKSSAELSQYHIFMNEELDNSAYCSMDETSPKLTLVECKNSTHKPSAKQLVSMK
ncbi:MAG TPA: hypothetical protein PKA63_01345 [Oligoflexia bacterium]|nr:hypothetical protein [Oligoflexia bacterium]HMP47294.1 hypothetical protein [Oligoflexia bacterium]